MHWVSLQARPSQQKAHAPTRFSHDQVFKVRNIFLKAKAITHTHHDYPSHENWSQFLHYTLGSNFAITLEEIVGKLDSIIFCYLLKPILNEVLA